MLVERNLKRVDYPLEHLYFEFENWKDHKLFLDTNHRHWTAYLTQFESFQSVDILICEEEEQLTRLIIWDSYKSWKEITPGDVKAVDVEHRKEFPHKYERKSQMFAGDKHPYNLVSRYFKEPASIQKYQNELDQEVLRFSINLNEAGKLEEFLKFESEDLKELKSTEEFINSDIFVNKFDPKQVDIYYYLKSDEATYLKIVEAVEKSLEKSMLVASTTHTKYGYLKREALFMNDK